MIKSNKNKSIFFSVAIVMVIIFTAFAAILTNALEDITSPTIISVSPANNEQGISRNDNIIVVFSEEMDASTINSDTFRMVQRTTPEFGMYRYFTINTFEDATTYSGRTAIFRPKYTPNQEFGNVFTMTLTPEIKDLAGNSLARNYMWSFTTGEDAFNTGLSTSQTDQTPIPVTVTPVIPVTTPTIPAIVPTTSSVPWFWIIASVILLILAIIILRMMLIPTTQKIKSDKFGDSYPVMDLEGIGSKYNKALQAMGIKTTAQLWKADASKISKNTGAPLSIVKSWQNMAELASIKGIGPQYAELLERSGVHSIIQLKNYEPNKLLELVQKKQDSLSINIQGNSLGVLTVGNWIESAKDHKAQIA